MDEKQSQRFEQRLTPNFISRNVEIVEAVKRAPLMKDYTTANDIELRLKTIGDGHGLGRADVVKFLQRIESGPYHAGNFVVGRRGQPSRFVWSGNILFGPQLPQDSRDSADKYAEHATTATPISAATSVTAAVDSSGQSRQQSGAPQVQVSDHQDTDRVRESGAPVAAFDSPSFTQSGRRLLKYTFPLQSDVLVQMELPTDLTEREADRLSTFIKSLAI